MEVVLVDNLVCIPNVSIAERVEYIASNSKDIELTKSEVVRIFLHAFFKSQTDKDVEKVRELAIKMRKGLL